MAYLATRGLGAAAIPTVAEANATFIRYMIAGAVLMPAYVYFIVAFNKGKARSSWVDLVGPSILGAALGARLGVGAAATDVAMALLPDNRGL
jgi:hypothetical protein